jgi:hypothetical protein
VERNIQVFGLVCFTFENDFFWASGPLPSLAKSAFWQAPGLLFASTITAAVGRTAPTWQTLVVALSALARCNFV